ncbi:MAG TPA: ABC transporter ATP-binding protein [Gammaproteobacteria bacterium]|nr:ABC transporter ATP-binding protein [Gammaproteobacteria bacterium]
MLVMQGLSKVFRTTEVETTALNAVDLGIAAGEFTAIMGPSGCGKSTLLNIIGMLDNPSSGRYFFLDEDVAKYPERKLAQIRKRNIGFIFQSFNLIDELTVFANVELPLVYQRLPAAERKRKVDAVLERVGIAARRNHFPAQLSGGQQQRVAVARALVVSPKLILADEPTGNLDTANGEEVMNMLVKLNEEGTTVIMVTHSRSHAEYARRIVNMLDGRVVTEHVGQMRRAAANV